MDALTFSGYFREGGTLETVLARGKIVEGVAMLCGSIGGGLIAQATNLGVPYLLRAIVLALSFAIAFVLMRDIGFTPSRSKQPLAEIKNLLRGSIEHGLGNPPVRWIMLEGLFAGGVTIYAFYAMQPYLLELYGDPRAYAVAGLAAAVVAGAQIAGGLLVPYAGRLFRRRTSVLLGGTVVSALMLAAIGLVPQFWVVVMLLVLWALMFAAMSPVRQAYLNGLIESRERATVLSFDSMLASTGAAVAQPALGRVADVWSYPASYVCSAAIHAMALPFIWLARREKGASDTLAPASGDARRTSTQ